MAAVVLGAGVGVEGASAAPAPPHPTTSRLAGATRYDTAAAIAREASLLYVPRGTPVAVGGPGVLSDARMARAVASLQLTDIAGRPSRFGRLAGTDAYGTQVAVSRRAFPSGAPVVYLASGADLADTAAATALTDGPVLLVPGCGALPPAVAGELARLRPQRIVGLGTSDVLCTAMLTRAAAATTARPRVGALDVATTGLMQCLLTDRRRVSCWGLTFASGDLVPIRTPVDVPALAGRYSSLEVASPEPRSTCAA